MPVIIRKAPCLADWLTAVFCMMIFLCAAPIATAQVEGAEGGQGAARAAKKKVAIAQFDVANTQHVDDINNIYDGLPLALSSRLEASGEFLSTYTGRSIPAEAGDAQREAITQIAGETGAQFLISGMVVNAGTSQKKGFWGTSLGRHIEVELAVYDGLTGARLLLRRLDEQAQGEVRVGNDKPFGSSIFFETELGQALNRLIDLAVKDIRKALENVPFSAHVIRVEEKKVFLDAGSDSLLKPGDKLVVYVRDATPIAGLKDSALGVTDRAADTVTLTRVQRLFSVGELPEEAAKLGIKAGNIARIDPAEQRNLAAKQMEAQQLAKAQQEARDEAARVELERAALVEAERLKAEAERVKAEQAAKAEADRIKAEKKAQAQAKAQAAAEAKAVKLKARQEARAARIKAAQEAQARELARDKARAAAEARAAKLKAKQEAKAEAARIKAEKKTQAEAEDRAAAETKAAAAPKSAKTKATQKGQAGMEVRAVAIEDLERAAAEAEAGAAKAEAEAAASVPPENKKPGVPLKLKQIKP